MEGIFSAWGRILTGYTPALAIEITRECPLHCPGCYAYGDDHLGGEVTLREVRLPIAGYVRRPRPTLGVSRPSVGFRSTGKVRRRERSEERRVGKECRPRW